jgi:hypothetical protein
MQDYLERFISEVRAGTISLEEEIDARPKRFRWFGRD